MNDKLNEINKLIKDRSDFSFEMKILNEVNRQGYKTEHAGTYLDPYTGLNREFDIRASKNIAVDKLIKLAVECKNISPCVPVVIHSVPNNNLNSYHTIIIGFDNVIKEIEKEEDENTLFGLSSSRDLLRGPAISSIKIEHTIDVDGNVFKSNYSDFSYIGKSIDKVAIKSKGQKNESLILNDDEIYNKYSQAINSTCDLIKELDGITDTPTSQCLIQPIFVVPDGSLVEIQYSKSGEIIEGSPKQSNRVPLYIGKTFTERELGRDCVDHEIRYMEIVTESGLKTLLEKYESNQDYDYEPTFISRDKVKNILVKAIKEYRY